ncbi:hypothetical protein FRC12_019441 [Ceratobasidium sp. 428]|nr:hypothetical protein FRC12_019441 [Ceratobasidium sp. 428]
MAINKRRKKTASGTEANTNASWTNNDASGATDDEDTTDSTPLDGSNFDWLAFEDGIELVDDKTLHAKCLTVLDTLSDAGISFGYFVWAVNYGNAASRTEPRIRTARKEFRNKYLISTLQNTRIPPRTDAKGGRVKKGKELIDRYALAITALRLRDEMRAFESSYENVKPAAFTQRDFLKSMDFDSIESLVHTLCPTIFCLLYMLSTSIYRRQHWASNKSDANFFIVMVICCMAYQLSSANNAFQRLFGYYFKAKRTPKGVVDMLSSLNLCMSYRSTLDTAIALSASIQQATLEAVHSRPFMIVHDNFRAQQKVASQRCDHQTTTDNGTAMTVIILRDSARPAWESPEDVSALRAHIERQRALGTPLRVRVEDLLDPARQARVLAHKIGHIFAILRAIPCLKGVAILSDPRLQYPPSWHQLESGPGHITEMYMLGTRPIDESSYSGNLMVIQEVMRQLGFDFGDPLVKLALERIVPWIGDELTIARLRMLIWLRQEDPNAYDRLDPFLLVFGWFHALMCLAFSTFENHRGSVAGFGLVRTVHTLQRTGFTMNMRKT